ncbi:FAD/FMN-containing dehydrogenase [Tistlia consotensis]|uniref:FAD/FMN-containing dehydrogenase n=1 Tax=Tistlia consotensis USBA 355 TaxID=560819 RepID=A0A1Y6BI43_9PROT|nr:FAD-binding oxidoreductase [Tistlia consotensis]SMF11475.1 FAD/FMN-containing dehydrogenase [Tistlia consotensis USBA 355]SNR51942.1 FAD/FMN-containing dehydrogenase [Tistlia consotensis]
MTRPARPQPGDSRLARRLADALEGEVLFDAFDRGRYSTDASVYQIEPLGVVVPRHEADVRRALDIAREEGLPVLPRGGGTSQCGQTVGECLVLDLSRHLDGLVELDAANGQATVQPGIVLDKLNRQLKPHGLWFPVDVSTSSRATIGGMAGNNSCGSRSLRYGTMRDNVEAVEAILADGTAMRFGPLDPALEGANRPSAERDLVADLLDLGRRAQPAIEEHFPKVLRRVGGYNLDALLPAPERALMSGEMARAPGDPANLGHFLIGSEGTLAYFERLRLRLSPLPRNKVLGVCHFPTFYRAMDAAQHIVKLGPTAVELVDRTMIELAREIPAFLDTMKLFVRGEPDSLLLVEFAEADQGENLRRLAALVELMGDLGLPGTVVEAVDPGFQTAIWEVRKQGLNIMMSMKGDGKPVSFVEDCAVRLEDLAEYTRRLDEVFARHGTKGTWYAHASVGTLHVRPVLNLKLEAEARKMREIAEEAFEMVRAYKGSHSGEHGDGLVRSEAHREMFGEELVGFFGEAKRRLDPEGRLNPGKIVDPSKMDDRSLFRFKPGYAPLPLETGLDWSAWGGFSGAVEMCNNNGACRKDQGAVMCPSFRVTRNERDLTRGRANALRLAASGQLGPDALTSDEMLETMKLCVGCKGCRRECPTGVDMARMKTEVLYQRSKQEGIPLGEKAIAFLPRYAPLAGRLPWLANARDALPGGARLGEALLGLAADRPLPRWSDRPFRDQPLKGATATGREVALFVDTFGRWFEPETPRAAQRVLDAAGYRVVLPKAADRGRPLCCGRTFLAAGLVEEARAEARRTLAALLPLAARGLPIVGLEPACLLTLRDEFLALLPGADSRALAGQALLFEEFLAAEQKAGALALDLKPLPGRKALIHGHCHQKAFAAFSQVSEVLRLVPELEVSTIESSCCGMAGAFGYRKETAEVSRAMAELSLLPAVRAADADTTLVADGTSCRHQIADGSGRQAIHAARLLEQALA